MGLRILICATPLLILLAALLLVTAPKWSKFVAENWKGFVASAKEAGENLLGNKKE